MPTYLKAILIFLLFCIVVPNAGGGFPDRILSASKSPATTDSSVVGEEIVISSLDNTQYLPDVAYNPNHNEYLVVWTNQWGGNLDIYAQRVSANGELLSWFAIAPHTQQNPYPNDRSTPSVAYDPVNDRYLVVWLYDTVGDGSNWDVHGILINWDGPIPGLKPIPICSWSSIQDFPVVAYSPAAEDFMVVWMSAGATPAYISGRRVRASDGALYPSDSDFTISHPSQARVRPEIAYNSGHNEYIIVYDNMNDVFATRIASTGAVLGGGEINIAGWPDEEIYPSVAYCDYNDQYLVAWQNSQPDIYAWFLNADGTTDGSPLHLYFTSVYETYPKVACSADGNRFLVVWQQQFSSLTGPFGVWGQFVSTQKTLGTSFEIMAPTSGVNAQFTTPAIAGGANNYLAVWEHDRAGTPFQDIHGSLITPHSVFIPLVLRNLH